MKKAARSLLAELAQTREHTAASTIVRQLEEAHGFRWRPIGDRENNYGLINIGSDPGYALIERVTNAIDAVIEREALRHQKSKRHRDLPASPREAVSTWLKVPAGRVANLEKGQRQQLADNIRVVLLDATSKNRPTLEVRDYGVGIAPSKFPDTIFSLGGSNKIDKPFLAGAYGQGGSTVLAFCPEGSLFVSRMQPDLLADGDTDLVGVSFTRYNDLDPRRNKNGRYEFLTDPDDQVAGIPPSLLPDFEPGTAVVHFNMEIPKYAARLTQLTGSLWWLLQNALFDPVLPFWAEERRASMLKKGQRSDRRTIAGNYTRLRDDSRDRIEYSDAVDVTVPYDGEEAIVKVNYWVVKAKEDGSSKQPIDAYVDPYRPISYTYCGQTHGTDERRFIAERLQLPHLAKFLIIQVELDQLPPRARRAILSTTRDRLKQVPFFEQMREYICQSLAEDENLIRLNDERRELLLSRHSEKERERMKDRFAQLMERFRAGVDASQGGDKKEKGGRPRSDSRSREPLKPLPTKDEPTFIRIANTNKPLPVQVDRHALLRIESDAPDSYLTNHLHARLTMTSEPEALKFESKSDFKGGRARVTVRVAEGIRPGCDGTLRLFLFTPQESVLTDKISFCVTEAKTEKTTGGKGRAQVQVPEPIPVMRDEWEHFGWNERSVAEVREDDEGVKIFVNIDNQHISTLLRGGRYQERGIVRMRTSYVLYVAFYSWLQHSLLARKDLALEGEEFEEYRDNEFDRVAQTVVHSISAGSRMADET